MKRAASLGLTLDLATRFRAEAAPPPAGGDVEDLLTELPEGLEVLRPRDAAYQSVTYYNGRFDCVRPAAFVRPRDREQLQNVVELARKHRQGFAVRGGGHSFEGRSMHPHLVIDMSHFDQISDPDSDGKLTVGAGVRLGAVYARLEGAGRVLPAGTCPTVGIVGHALGGGLGDFTPMLGYTAQSLSQVSLVTLSGAILEVDDDSIKVINNPDGDRATLGALEPKAFMQALRGGGQGSFGIVTSMTFQTYRLSPDRLASFRLGGAGSISRPRAIEIIRAWQRWRGGLPAEMQSWVSSKLNLGRSAGGYGIEIAGLIVLPEASSVSMDAVRSKLEPRIPGFKETGFTHPLSVPAALKTFLDNDETSNNSKRKRLYGSSSLLPSDWGRAVLPEKSVEYLIDTLSPSIFVSFYTTGGKTLEAPATSLHPSQFAIEWTTYLRKRDAGAHEAISKLRSGTMASASGDNLAFPSYPDAGPKRSYFTNQRVLEDMRRVLDPYGLSTSSLVSGGPARSIDSGCR